MTVDGPQDDQKKVIKTHLSRGFSSKVDFQQCPLTDLIVIIVIVGWAGLSRAELTNGQGWAARTHQLISSSIQPINSSTYRLINPWPFGTFLPGPADCALRD